MGRTLLSAVKSGNVVLAKKMITKGLYGNIDSQDPRQDGTALFWACSNGLTGIVHLLIYHGANLEACTAWCATPLHASADNNQLDIARFLIRLGANVNKKTIYGDTPCHLAAYRGHQQMVQMLVELGDVDLNLTNSKNRTSLDESILGSHSHVTNYICHVMSQKNSIPVQLSDHLMTEMSLDLTEEEENSSNQNETNSHSSKEMLSFESCKFQENQSANDIKIFKMVSQTSSLTPDEDSDSDCSFTFPPSPVFSVSFPNFDQELPSDFNYLSDSPPVSPTTHSCSNIPNYLNNNNIFWNDLSSASAPPPESIRINSMNYRNIFAIKC